MKTKMQKIIVLRTGISRNISGKNIARGDDNEQERKTFLL